MTGSRSALAWLVGTTLFLTAAPRLHAQSATAGTPVAATHLAAESNPSVLADGAGGAFIGFKIAWRGPTLPAEVAVARVLPSAGRHPDWAGLPPLPAGSLPQTNPFGPARILPAPGGKVLTFADFASASPADQLLTRTLQGDGADPAYAGFSPNFTYSTFTVLPRSDGGALVLSKLAGAINCMVTVVSPTGVGTETPNSIPVGNGQAANITNDRVTAVPSGTDGAIAMLLLPNIDGFTATGIDILAVKVDAAGQMAWTPPSRAITAAVRDQGDQVAVPDGAGGIIAAWLDLRVSTGGGDIFATRLLSTGVLATGWTNGGKAVASGTGAQYAPVITSDDAGGAWIAWVDERNPESAPDIYFTHLLADGTLAPGFVPNGRGLYAGEGSQAQIQVVRDGNGGFFAVWIDARDGEADLYAQHFDASGVPSAGWDPLGEPVCTDGTPQAQPALGLVSNGRAIVAWKDPRTGTDVVYAAALDAALGVLDAPRPSTGRLALAPAANPARDAVELRLDGVEAGEVRVTLYDVTGRVEAEQSLAGPARAATVRFAGLRPGLYFARAIQGSERTDARVVVVK